MTEPFSNEPIEVGHLPQLHADAFVAVDPRCVWADLAGLASLAVVAVGVAAVVVAMSGNVVVPMLVAGGIVVLVVVIALVSVLEARRLAYQLREHDVSLRSGVFRHRVETIPFSRIQHVSVGRGLVERWLGLATLEVSSAGPDISVPGLSVADADRIKQVVADATTDVGPLLSTPWPAP